MTGIHNETDTLTVFGWRLEKRTTVQGAIQTVLLIVGLIAAPFAMYYGLTKRLTDIEDAQAVAQQNITEINSNLDNELTVLENRVDGISARLSVQETTAAVAASTDGRTQQDIANLSSKIDSLDNFLRSYITGNN